MKRLVQKLVLFPARDLKCAAGGFGPHKGLLRNTFFLRPNGAAAPPSLAKYSHSAAGFYFHVRGHIQV